MVGEVGGRWISSGSASELLGVSESTIRRLADGGEIKSYRTGGGHRRLLRSDVEEFLRNGPQSSPRDIDQFSEITLERVKSRLHRVGPNPAMTATADLEEPLRVSLRFLGRQLVDLFARYIASSSRGERFFDDARGVGREYGRTLVKGGISLTVAVTIFNHLRHSFEETAVHLANESSLNSGEAVEVIEDISRLAAAVLEGMALVYESSFTTDVMS